MYDDHRFARVTRTTWALRQWGRDEYEGTYGEIARRIDAAGGIINVATLLRDMTTAFPDVAESSIRTYLNAPGFVLEHNKVRRRTEADSWPPVAPLQKARGAFRNGRNQIRLAIPVTTLLSARADLDRWMSSHKRREILEAMSELTESRRTLNVIRGYAGWFNPPGTAAPKRWKQAVAVVMGLILVSMAVAFLRQAIAPNLPLAATVTITAVVNVVVLTWLVMPLLTRILHRWLTA